MPPVPVGHACPGYLWNGHGGFPARGSPYFFNRLLAHHEVDHPVGHVNDLAEFPGVEMARHFVVG